MVNSKRTGRILVGMIGFVAVISIVTILTRPMYAEASADKPWLMRFEGGPVSVTFISALPEKSRTVDARLISVESFGVVLRFPKERDKFFSYANIISIDPK